MSLYNSFDLDQLFGELLLPRDTQMGVLTPAQRQATAQANLFGAAFVSGVLVSPNKVSSAVGDKFTQVPNVASGGVLAAHITDAMTDSLRIQSTDGTLYYVMLTKTVTNRTGGA